MNEIVNAVGEEVQITNDFLSLLVGLVVVVVRTLFVRVFKYFFKNQKCQNSTCKYIIYNTMIAMCLLKSYYRGFLCYSKIQMLNTLCVA